MQSQAVQVWQLLELTDVCKPVDLVAVKVEHFERLELQNVVTHFGDIVKAEIKPGDILRKFNDVQRHL